MGEKITILGAGPTGLGAAYRLAELGHDDWDIYERADHVGGLASSYRRPARVHLGPRRSRDVQPLHATSTTWSRRCSRGDYDQHMREAWVWMHGRFVPYPFQNNIHRLPPDVFLECIMGIIEAQTPSLPRDELRRSGSPPCSARASPSTSCSPYNFKVWAHPLEMMGTSWQGDRVPDGRRAPHPARTSSTIGTTWLGPEQQVQVPAARHRHALRPHRRVAARSRCTSTRRPREIDVAGKVVTFADGIDDALRPARSPRCR